MAGSLHRNESRLEGITLTSLPSRRTLPQLYELLSPKVPCLPYPCSGVVRPGLSRHALKIEPVRCKIWVRQLMPWPVKYVPPLVRVTLPLQKQLVVAIGI